MSQQTPNIMNTVATGGCSTSPFITIFSTGNPNPSNVQYSVQQRWLNTATGAEFILAGFISFNGALSANWIEITEGSSNITSITGNSGGAVPGTGGNINIVGDTTTINIVGNPGTSTLTASIILPAGAHQVLIGETTSIAGVTPSATTGIPLISQGNLSDPIFGTASVAGGGTGNASQTAYSLVAGGTTSTSAFQAIGPNASTHAVLLATGASSLPAFTTTGTAYFSSISFDSGADLLSAYIGQTTWSPVVTFGGLSTGITYAANVGSYQVIGNIVIVYFEILLTSKGSATGIASITGFPYTASTAFASCALYYENITLPSGINDIVFVLPNQTTGAQFQGVGSNQPQTILTNADFSNTTFISATGVFLN